MVGLVSQWGQQGYRPAPQGYQNAYQWGLPRSQAPQESWGRRTGPSWSAAPTTSTWNPNVGASPTRRWAPPQSRPEGGGKTPIIFAILVALGFIVAATVVMLLIQGGGQAKPSVPTGGYQNEDYQVPEATKNPPELPIPDTYEEAKQWMQSNAIYQVSLHQPVECTATPIDLENASTEALEKHFNEFTGCLMKVFGPALEEAGYTPVRPTVTIYSSEITTKCGEVPMQNAVYCGADQQVYYAVDLPDVIPSNLKSTNYIVESVIAHEFGHAIQARTGILVSELAWEQESSESTALSLSRRLETQADCFAGEFISTVAQSVSIDNQGIADISNLFYAIGDDQLSGDPNYEGNHGHGDSRQSWFWKGSSSPNMGTCNTFIASDSEVK